MFIELNACTEFAAHNDMCSHLESMEDSVLKFSLRGRHNFLLMEHVSQDETVTRYIIYVFLVCTEERGWLMKIIREDEQIPNADCPVWLIKQSTMQSQQRWHGDTPSCR